MSARSSSWRGVASRPELWILLAAFVLRLVHILTIRDNPLFEVLTLDAESYDRWARDIAAGRLVREAPFYQAPLYAYFLALQHFLSGGNLLVPRLVNVVLGTLHVGLAMLLGRRLYGRACGLVAGLLVALTAPFFFEEGKVTKTTLGVVLATATLLLLVEARHRERARWWLAAGVVGAAAALVRENFLLFLVAAVLWTAWRTRRTGVRPAVVLALGGVLALLPSTLHNFSHAHEFLPLTSQAGQNFFIGNHPGNPGGGYLVPDFVRRSPRFEETDFAREAERRAGRTLTAGEVSNYWRGEALRFIRENPLRFLSRFVDKLGLLYNDFEIPDDEDIRFFRRFAPVLRLPLLTFGVFGVLGLFGLLVQSWRRTVPGELALFIGVYSVSVALFFVFARYRLPLVAPLAVLAAERLQAGVRALGARRFRRLGLGLVAMIPLALLVYRPLDARTTFANSHLSLGIAYEVKGENAAAMHEYRLGLELEPQNAKLLRRLARLAALETSSAPPVSGTAHQAREAELLDLLERAVQANPEDTELRFRNGTALARAGRPAEAALEFERILQRGAAPPGVHANLAFLYEELGRPDEARDQARLALERTPRDTQLENLLQRLGDR